VTHKARGILDLDRACQIQRPAVRRIPFAECLEPARRLPEHVDDVDLPVGGVVAGIGRIERRLLIAVVGILLAHVVELLGGGEGGHRLRQKPILELRLQERFHLGVGVDARGRRRFHHDPGVLQHFLARIGLQHLVRDVARQREAHDKDRKQRSVEFPD
jgi:hypothetical protein